MTRNEVDPESVLHQLGLSRPTATHRVKGGADTAIWRVEHGSDIYALRLFRPEQAESNDREVAAMEAAALGGIPVPRIHVRGVWNGRPVMLLSWCPGKTLLRQILTHPWRALSYGVMFGRVQAEIHALAAPTALLETGWIDWAGNDETSLREKLQRIDLRVDRLLHLDYHILNVMADGDHITGVLDWTNGRAGDPRADMARTVTILRLDMGRPALPRVFTLGMSALWLAFERGWRRGYREVAGPEGDLTAFYAWAGAVMGHDLGQRYSRERLEHVHRWTERWKRRAGIDL